MSERSELFTTQKPKTVKIKLTAAEKEQVLKHLSTLNPLTDKAFKIALSREAMFRLVTKEITGEEIGEGKFNYNGEISFTVRGKKVIPDVLVNTEKEWIDMEEQQETSKFPFERHLHYWAAIYAQSLTEGMEYKDLLPVTVIVIYKDKDACSLIEESTLGGMLSMRAKNNHLRLIAVNAAMWRSAKSNSLRMYLSLLRHGLVSDVRQKLFEGIDFTTSEASYIYEAVRESCAKSLLELSREKGDTKMSILYEKFITEEEEKVAKSEGRAEGRVEGKVEVYYNDMNLSVDEISKKVGVSVDEVKKILKL